MAEPTTSSVRTARPPDGGAAAADAQASAAPAGDASVAAVTQNYTNYVVELQASFEGLRQRAAQFQETGPAQIAELQNSIQPQTQELISALQEVSAPIQSSPALVSSVFSWASVMMLAAQVSSVLGGYFLSPFLGVFLGRFGSALLAYFAVPAAGYYLLKNAESSNDAEKRFTLLSLSLAQGLLAGHALAYTYVTASPIMNLTPVVVAFGFPLVVSKVQDRVQVLGALLGGAFAIHLALGVITGYLTGTYFVAAVLYTLASGATLQVAFKNLTAENQVHFFQLGLVAATMLAKGLVFGVFGGNGQQQN